jgi:hypothetical protein
MIRSKVGKKRRKKEKDHMRKVFYWRYYHRRMSPG